MPSSAHGGICRSACPNFLKAVTLAKLSPSVCSSIHQFSYWIANRTVGLPVLDGIDYSAIFEEPSALQIAYAIFCNVLEFDQTGTVTNAKLAERRAAQWIRQYCEPGYVVEPRLRTGK